MRYIKKMIAAVAAMSVLFANVSVLAEEKLVSDILTDIIAIDDNLSEKEIITAEPEEIIKDREDREIVFKFKKEYIEELEELQANSQEDVIAAAAKEIADSLDARVKEIIFNTYVVLETDNDVRDVMLEMYSNKKIAGVHKNYKLYASSNEVVDEKQWAIENNGQTVNGVQGIAGKDLNIKPVWDETKGSEEIVVAVIDTGIDINHPALQDRIWHNPNESSDGTDSDNNGYTDDINGWDFVNNDASVFDEKDSHGTHMAGIIAANGYDNIYGVAPNVKIMPIKILENGVGYTSDLYKAIRYAKENGADIINCSFTASTSNYMLNYEFSSTGALCVLAANNNNNEGNRAIAPSITKNYLISVGGYDNTGEMSDFSQEERTDVFAPATDIYSTLPFGEYGYKSGNSCAAAYASGVAALILSQHSDATVAELKSSLLMDAAVERTRNLKASLAFFEHSVKSKDYDLPSIFIPGVSDVIVDDYSESRPFHFYGNEDGIIFKIYVDEEFEGDVSIFEKSEGGRNDKRIFCVDNLSKDNNVIDVTVDLEKGVKYGYSVTYTRGRIEYSHLGYISLEYFSAVDKYLIDYQNIYTSTKDLDAVIPKPPYDVVYDDYISDDDNISDDIIKESDNTVNKTQNVSADTAEKIMERIEKENLYKESANYPEDYRMAAYGNFYERESNNTISTANEIRNDYDNFGTISTQNDVDWYKVYFAANGVANFWIGEMPQECDYMIELYNASGTKLSEPVSANAGQKLIPLYPIVNNNWYYIKVYSLSGYNSTKQYKLRTKWYPSPDEYENNDSFTTATKFYPNTFKTANINHPEDIDFYSFTLTEKKYVELKLSNIPSGCRYDMSIYSGADENFLIEKIESKSSTKYYDRVLSPGTYYIKLYSYNSSTYSPNNYRLDYNVNSLSNLPLSGSIWGSTGDSDKAYYKFSMTSRKAIDIRLTSEEAVDFDLHLYEVTSGGKLNDVAHGTSSSWDDETVSATLPIGDYVLVAERCRGTADSHKLTVATTSAVRASSITVTGLPSVMSAGESTEIVVTVKNLGMDRWTNSTGYMLKFVGDAVNFSSEEVILEDEQEVGFNESVSFVFTITAPNRNVTKEYTLKYRMAQNGTAFGDTYSKIVNVLSNVPSITAGSTKAITGVTSQFYKLNVSSGSNYVFRTMFNTKACDTTIYLYDSLMNCIDDNDDIYYGKVQKSNRYSKLEKYLTAGTYYVGVKEAGDGVVNCYLNVETYTEESISRTANISNKYEGYFKYTVSSTGTYVFFTSNYVKSCDTYLVLLDSNGNVIAKNNDTDHSFYSKIEKSLTKGIYYLRVSTNDYLVNGNNKKTYCTLTVGNKSVSPPINDSSSINISSFEMFQLVKLYDDNRLNIRGTAKNCCGVKVKVNGETLSGVKFENNQYVATYLPESSGEYKIDVTGIGIYDSDPSDSVTIRIAINDDTDDFKSSTPVEIEKERVAAIDYIFDVDCFSFRPKSTGAYKIYSEGDIDIKAVLYANDKETVVEKSYNSINSQNFTLARTLEKDVTYYLEVSAEDIYDLGEYKIKVEKLTEPKDFYFKTHQWGIMNFGSYYNEIDNVYSPGIVGADVNVVPVWEYTKGAGVRIGIIDTGIDFTHPDLIKSKDPLVTGKSFVYDYPEPLYFPDNPHGTQVAGVAASSIDDVGIVGVAPEATFVSLQTFRDEKKIQENNPNPTDKEIEEEEKLKKRKVNAHEALKKAVEYAKENDIDIINCSFISNNINEDGSISYDLTDEQKAGITNIIDCAPEILFVICSGNQGVDLSVNDYYPMSIERENVIVVSSIDSDGAYWERVNYGGTTDLAAPGGGVFSTDKNHNYLYCAGSSMSAPFVTGAAALIMSYYPELTPGQVKERIININNVTYDKSLEGRVESNGYLNIWRAFCNDMPTSKGVSVTEDEISKLDEKNAILKSIMEESNSSFKNQIRLKLADNVTINDIEELLSSDAHIVEDAIMSDSYLIEFSNINSMKKAAMKLNRSEMIEYARPEYAEDLIVDVMQ